VAWQDTASAATDVITAGALAVGGAWGYFRFARGRIFATRAEVEVVATLLQPPLSGLRVKIAVKNTGASQLKLSDLRFVEAFAISQSDWPTDTNVDWGKPVITTRVLKHHDWLESSEIVNEEVLVPLATLNARGKPFVAFLVVVHISAPKRRRRKSPTGWTAQAVVLPEDSDATQADSRIPNGTGLDP
jgi:hypothetical protein